MNRAHIAGLSLVLAFATHVACSPSTSGSSDASAEAAADAGKDAADAGVACDYPPVQNDPSCPAAVPGVAAAYGSGDNPCSPIGLDCVYPGMGDCCSVGGCYFTGVLMCVGDAGPDSGHWIGAQ